MKILPNPLQRVLLVLVFVGGLSSLAQEHRATVLGNPQTRFAPPRRSTEDVRKLLLDEVLKPDVATVLRQAGWQGRVQDLWTAVRTAEIRRIELPVGTRMPFMASRRNGFPIALKNVVWAGEQPVEAYTFLFSSQGRGYQLIMPAPCSNFYVVDAILPKPGLSLTLAAPARTGWCDLLQIQAVLANTGDTALAAVELALPLPAGLRPADEGAGATFELGELPRGESRTVTLNVVADSPGTYAISGRATGDDDLTAAATATTQVLAPRLALECGVNTKVLMNRPAEVCLTVRNEGDLAEPEVTVVLPIPEGATVREVRQEGVAAAGAITWQLPALAPGESRQVCAVLTADEPRELRLESTAKGGCAQPVSSQCEVRFMGIPAILLEVVDLLDPVLVGDAVDYEIRVTNQGSAAITQVRLSCDFPDSQKFLAGTGPTAFVNEGGRVTTEPLARLAPKATAVWKVKAEALSAGDSRFRVELSGDQFPRPIEELEATTQF
ncbi:MAG: hypothetical protein H7A46_14355 [Verrucomicrobiales bacterium]|nr:hypothetical protein [Verrucomicrobiales bacterium]